MLSAAVMIGALRVNVIFNSLIRLLLSLKAGLNRGIFCNCFKNKLYILISKMYYSSCIFSRNTQRASPLLHCFCLALFRHGMHAGNRLEILHLKYCVSFLLCPIGSFLMLLAFFLMPLF